MTQEPGKIATHPAVDLGGDNVLQSAKGVVDWLEWTGRCY
jgi:hypothetical protein